MNQVLRSIDDVKEMLNDNKKLILAGDETVLSKLPEGHWIGGTIPYFMSEKGGLMTRDLIHVTEIPSYIKQITIKAYTTQTVPLVYEDAPENGFSVIIIPASSETHLSFALNAPTYAGFATRPLIGWIAGVHVDEIGNKKAKIFFGDKSKVMEDGAVVMHLTLPSGMYADLNILNIFKQGSGDTLTFPEDSFSVQEVFINDQKYNMADYIAENKLDTQLPLVADYSGAMINTSFQNVDEKNKRVSFYAPVFKGVEYRHAATVGDYVKEFTSHMPSEGIDRIFFSCNCILNYLYSELEGKRTKGITGPITFGEIAYQLLNQTMAYLTINKL
jgi:hypothetical protein